MRLRRGSSRPFTAVPLSQSVAEASGHVALEAWKGSEWSQCDEVASRFLEVVDGKLYEVRWT